MEKREEVAKGNEEGEDGEKEKGDGEGEERSQTSEEEGEDEEEKERDSKEINEVEFEKMLQHQMNSNVGSRDKVCYIFPLRWIVKKNVTITKKYGVQQRGIVNIPEQNLRKGISEKLQYCVFLME